MGKIRGVLLFLALGISVSTGQVQADEIIENCTQVTASGTDDTDSTPNNADFTKDPALFEDDESCVRVTKVVPYDYGDAPDPTFPTTEANSGAKHLLGNNVYLGSCVDNDTGSLQGDATADDQNAGAYTFGTCNGTDDEDGVTFPELTIAATGLSLDVVSNASCKLNAWIDWNGDGDWNDTDEQIATDQDLVAGNNTVPLNVAISARAGDVYSRFRCSTLGGDTTTGEAADGEVEDYKVTIKLPDAGFTLKKYVQAAATAPAATANASDYDPTDANNILGDDAQSSADAVRIDYNQAATYRIRIENTGGTWLSNVSVDDQMSACTPLTKIYESDATTATGTLSPGEVEVYECTLAAVIDDVANIAKAWATPAYPPITPAAPEPTGQPEISPEDPAHVQTTGVASIVLKKYVQQSTDAANNPVAAFAIGTPATWGEDAQDGDSGVWITYGRNALYTLIVENTGETPLSDVQVDDEIENCEPLTKVYDSDGSTDARPENVMAVGEIWAFQCTLENIQQTVTNIAEARGTPIEPLPANPADPLQPTGQTPPVDIDPAVVMTQYNSAIDIKKYVMPAPDATATAIVEGSPATYGNDAQDSASAQNIVFGETATFRIRVENTGTTWLDNVVVDDQIENCSLDQNNRIIDTDATTPDGVMSIGEVWWMECDLIAIQDSVVNTATVKARPIQTPDDPNGPYEPTNQSEVNDTDPANVTTNSDAAILLKKYVQPATGAAATITDPFATWNATWGDDAQSNVDAVSVTYTESALYRIRVQNTGSTWLNSVVVDDQLAACDPLTKVEDSDNTTAVGIMSPNEIWWLECTQADVVEPITNIATVTATPAKSPNDATDPLGNTGQPNISDDDPANVDTSADPRIELKKYVQQANTALGWNPADLTTLGDDAQDSQSAVGIDYNTDALYRITVTNTGATWLSAVVVDDLIDACTLTRIDDGDADVNDLLSPNERWVYECTLATVTDDTLANTATVSAQPVNPDGTTTDQSPVNDTDPAHIKTGSHSIGNMVWIDDGNGNSTFANNGLLDNGETLVANGVQVELFNADGSVNIANTVTTNGFYLFDHLPAGQYTVCLSEANFNAGNILAAYGPSTGGNEANPNDDIDNNDNGEDDLQSGICSAVLDLGSDEPTQETAANGNVAGQDGQGTSDLKSNLTVDFGVIPSYSLGNQIWIDDGAGTLANANNGQLDAGELPVPDAVQLELLDANDAVIANTTPNNGYYLFNNLTPADYKVRIAASNFAQGGVLEGFQSCTQGNEADANINGDGNDNGIDADPTLAGITTSTVTIGDNEPTLEQPTQSGIAGNDGSNRPDGNTNLTVDLCVVKLTGIGNRLWIDESDPAARDAAQINNAIFDANEEPVANAVVHIFPEGADPKTTTAYASTQTDAQGCYHVNDLPEGRYFVHIPATEFANGKPLENYISSTGAGTDNGTDENADENGADSATPEADGLSSIVYDLMAGQEVSAEAVCGTNPTSLADNSIDDTADFGFVRANPAGVPVVELKKYVQAATGAPAYNAADDATLGQDAQTNNTAAFIPYDQSALYRITVANTGTVHLANVNPNDEVSDNVADCDLQRIDPVDARIVLAPGERWVYECSLANIREDIINTADVTATPIEPPADPSDPAAPIIPTGQSPVRDSDNAHVDTGSYSIGNMVWIDDGSGNMTYANDGIRNVGEAVVPDGVTIELQDAASATLAETVTTDGYYLFSQLTAGDYKVCIKAENFAASGLLASYVASTGGNEVDPNLNVDNNDNGDDDTSVNVCSGVITLADDEPTRESPTDNGQAGQDGQGTADNKSNLTVDFAVVPSYSLGNQIWIDDGAGTPANANNGKLDVGELPVDDTVSLELLDANDNVIATTNPTSGFYLFEGLAPDDYKVRIAASNFAPSGVLEGFQSCARGNEADANNDRDGNDNGLDTDPVTGGITTSIVTLGDNEPTLEQPTQSGIAGNDGSNRPDSNTNLTVDLCVVKLVGLGNRIWIDESDPAARDGNQINNGIFDTNEEPAANVAVEVFLAGANPTTDTPYATTTTDAGGCYHFNGLAEGQYFVHLPAEEFANGNKLEGLISSTGAGADDGTDENADENGQDGSTPKTDGISSIVYQLTVGSEPTGEPVCGTNTTLLADNSVDDTADFGLVRAELPSTPSISIKKYVQPLTGAPAYDANNDVTLGQDAQTNDAEVSILYRETALYRITVTNTGGVHLSDVNPNDEIADCNLQRIDPVDTRVVLAPNERWVYECTLDEIKQDVTNIAKVSGTPIEPPVDSTLDPADPALVLIPTGQTKPSDVDPAVITTTFGPSITLKKFVLDKAAAPTLVEGDTSTYGADAQDDRAAFNITYANDALYRIRVMNNGTTWLNNVVMSERLEACQKADGSAGADKVIDTNPITPAGVMSVGEIWWFECTLPKVIEPVTNIADVKADPVHVPEDPANPPVVLEATGQSPIYDTDPANVTTYIGPSIVIKKYVQPATNAKVFDETDPTSWGQDAQDTASAVNIVYTEDALYRIMVHNTGETWLDQVVVDEQIEACNLQPIAGTTDSSDGFMDPNEIWWFECTLSNITDDVMNLATVDAVPTHDDKTTTEHAPINDTDPANIHTTADPRIAIKKYVQDADGAPQWNILDDMTLGQDAQDSQQAVLIDFAGTALYRIKVTNTGATWLDNVVVDDVIDNCSLQRTFQSLDADEVLAPNEFWIYECTLSDVRDETLANTATVEARPINEDGSSRDQSPVDATDEAHIITGSHSIGNMIWIDDGKGNPTYANNGLRDNDEAVAPNGVKVELFNGDGSQLLEETVTTDGYYLFHHLPAGQYQVCVSSTNFASGQLLQAYGPSTGGNETDPNDNVDNNDNGDDTIAAGLCSGTLELAANEPLNETSTDGGAAGQDGQGTDDNKSNLTVDFGLTLTYSLGNQIWIDDGAGLLENANNGKLDSGEQPVDNTVLLELLDVNGSVVDTTTPVNGFYLFDQLAPADYRIRIAADNFVQGGVLEGFQSCTHGNESDANEDRDGNDNGLDTDPLIDGISTSLVSLGDNEPTLEKPTVDGVNGSDGSNRPDVYTNLTVDLCVVKLTGIGNRIWLDESNPNLRDVDEVNNASYDDGELTVANAEVQLFPENADPDFDDYYAITTTDRFGCYHFNNLPEGKYFVHVPAYQAVVTGDVVAALSAYVSSSGEGADNGVDDTQDENGKDDFDANSPGISSIVFDLKANQEPVNEKACGNNKTFLADNSIDDTADFGLVSDLSLGDRIWIDGNANGIQDAEEHPLPGATVELLQDGNVIAQAVTNENGNYLFGQLAPDDYTVRVRPPVGYYPTLIFSDDPNVDSNIDSDCQAVAGDTVVTTRPITLELGNEPVNDGDVLNPSSNLTVDCGFYRPVAVGNLIWEDLKNVDGILNNNEPGLDNMTVELVQEDGSPVTDVFGQPVNAVTTANDGKYIFENLTPDTYIVNVTPPSLGYVLTKPSGDKPDENTSDVDSNCLVSDPSNNMFSTPAFNLFNNTEPEGTIDADDTDRDMTVDCGFYRPVSVGNIIWIDDDGNGIREPDEYLLSGATVTLLDPEGNPAIDIFGNEVEPQETGEDGEYMFPNLSDGDYLIHVRPPEGYTPTTGVDNPNDDYNFDSNCLAIEGDVTGSGLSQIISLEWGTEPTDDGDADFATNQSVGCGFKPNVFNIPTLSEWAYILLMLLMSLVAWRMRGFRQ